MSLASPHDSSPPAPGVFSHFASRLSERLAVGREQMRLAVEDWLGSGKETSGLVRRAYGNVSGWTGAAMGEQEEPALPATIDENMVVHQPAHVLYAFWRDFENLPTLWQQLDDVAVIDFRRSHWVAVGPSRGCVAWDVEIFDERDGEWLAWRSTAGDLSLAGRVLFDSLTPLRTAMHVTMHFAPAAEGAPTPAELLGENFAERLTADLRSFKRAMETGGLLPAAST